jgi:hypothetical protein
MEEVQIIAEGLVPIVAVVVLGALLALIPIALRWFSKVTGIKVSNETRIALEGIARGAVGFAEQRAHTWAKNRGATLEPNEKLQTAVDFATREIQRQGLDVVVRDRLVDYIEAELGAERRTGGEP